MGRVVVILLGFVLLATFVIGYTDKKTIFVSHFYRR